MGSFRSCFNSYLTMLWKYGLIIVFCLTATFLLARCDDYTKASSNVAWCLPDLVALFAAAIAALNALLLYKTLMSQNVNFERQKYESTFFNLLNSHQKMTEGLLAQDQTISLSLEKYMVTINGRQFFTFAMREIGYIGKSLKGSAYRYCFNKEEEQRLEYERVQWLASCQEPYSPQKEEQEKVCNQEDCLVKLANDKYQITKEEWEKKHSSKFSEVDSFLIFERRWCDFYEHYIRSIKQLINYTQSQSKVKGLNRDTNDYLQFIISTMTYDEIRFIKLYCECHEKDAELVTVINNIKNISKES